VAPDGWVVDVSTKQAWYWRSRQESNALTSVVTACEARLAGVADDVGLNGYPVAHPKACYARMHSNDLAGRLMSENVIAFDYHGTDTAMLPEVNVRPASKRE